MQGANYALYAALVDRASVLAEVLQTFSGYAKHGSPAG